ncbi:hypothetical protein IP88_11350 [alpha proteobacterium AAP81b]|nr:hypothetical protein IP88_11350 [alpha proteobacterium AAP81b]
MASVSRSSINPRAPASAAALPAFAAFPAAIAPGFAPPALARLLGRAEAALVAWRSPAVVVEMLVTGLHSLRSTLNRDRWLACCAAMQAHPLMALLRQDPLIARSLDKPRGYAGDAVAIDMMVRHADRRGDLAGASPLGRGLHLASTGTEIAAAVRRRQAALAKAIDAAADRTHAAGRSADVLALAAGHLREVEAARAHAGARLGRIAALEPDEKTASVVAKRLARRVEVVAQPVSALARGLFDDRGFDLAYATGLYDMLDLRLATRLTRAVAERLRPGGRLLFTSMASDLWDAGFLEAAMAWHPILRDEAELQALLATATRGLEGIATRTWADDAGSLIWCEVARSA